MQIYKNDFFLNKSTKPTPNGTSIIHYTDESDTPMQLTASSPKRIYITKSFNDYEKIKSTINKSIKNGHLWVIATSYEWGVAQLGQSTPHAHAIFMEYDDYETHALSTQNKLLTTETELTVQPFWDKAQFSTVIQNAQNAIKEGNIYQINLSYPSEVLINSSLESLYKSIFLPQAPKHGAFIHTDFCTIASCSPEEFFYYKDGKIRTRPIKGTIGRHQDRIKDHKAYKQLKNSDKDLAELIMITDLMRNDLSMCAEQNSVQTTTLCEIIPFHYVYHLMSTIEAKTKPSLTPLDILTTLSPGGSITGCPKYAACELIAELEPYPRNFYTGHIGFINGLNEASFNVAIRTCYQYNANPIMTHSGCGITVDSHSDQEYQESLDKLRFITDYALDDVTTSLN